MKNKLCTWVFFFVFFVCLGKVAVKKEDLQKYHGKDTWFQLQPVSADSEVQVSTEECLSVQSHTPIKSNCCLPQVHIFP